MNGVLARLNERMAGAAEGRRPLVVMYARRDPNPNPNPNLNPNPTPTPIPTRTPNPNPRYGHSMCGAALSILTGNGKQVDGESYLGFDGKYIMPNATPVYLHKA